MKIAIIHPFLDIIGGAEKVALTLAEDLNADVITTNYNSEFIKKQGFSKINVKSIGNIPKNAPFRQQKALTLFFTKKLPKYDLYIVTGEWAMSALIRNKPNIWYVHSPLREIWDLKDYVRETKVLPYQRFIFDLWVLFNRAINKICLKNTKFIICNSKNTQRRVMTFFSRDSLLIYPPIETKKIKYGQPKNYWLSQNRLTPHKRIELQIEAFRALKNEKLIIIGCYEKSNVFNDYVEYIKKIKPKNVEIRSFISEKEKNDLYTHCKGLIATSIDEDFGMNAVEAMSAGKPVIAVNEGGYKETVIEGKTGHLVEAKVESIIKAIEKIKSPLKYQKASEKQAKKFSRERFISEIKKIISLFEKKEDKQIKIGTYDNIAKIYDKRLNSKTISEENLFLKEINTKGKTILDLGCGTGRLSSKLAKKAKKIIAIDNSKNMIRLAKAKKIPNAKFIHSNMEKLPFKKSSFDIIISSLSIEHIKDFEKVLKEIKRVLKTNGKFIFSISNKINNSTYIHFETQKEIVKIKNYLKPKKYYLKKLIENGFQIKKISSVKIHPKLKKLNQNIYDFWKGKTMSYIINTKKI